MITPMKKVLLGGRLADRERILLLLREAGVVHVEPVHPDLVFAPPDLAREISRASEALEILDKVKPAPAAAESPGSAAALVEELHEYLSAITRLDAEQTELVREQERVAPWGAIPARDLEVLRQNGLRVEFLTCPEDREVSIVAELLHTVTVMDGIAYLVAVSRDPIQAGAATRVAQPSRDVIAIEAALARIDAEREAANSAVRRLAAGIGEIRDYQRELLNHKRMVEVEKSLVSEGPVFVLKGWVPEDSLALLQEALSRSGLRLGARFSDPEDTEEPPTKLKNPSWCRPIEILFKLLGITPGYRETDISPFFLPFLTIFTAMLFADAGYGLVGLLPLVFGYRKLTAKGAPKQALDLFIILFAGCVVYGVYTNSYFGTALIDLTSFDRSSPQGEYALKKLCFILGATHLSLAHIWKIRQNPIGLQSLSEVGWVMFAWSMYALICVMVLGDPRPWWMIVGFQVGLTLVLLFTAPNRNVLKAIASGLGAIALSSAGFLSDIISYIRLWAVGLAGGTLAASFNDLARPMPLVVAVVILITAHLMNMALALVAVFAHGIRLNLLEFSNHVGMEWSGREYEPFKQD